MIAAIVTLIYILNHSKVVFSECSYYVRFDQGFSMFLVFLIYIATAIFATYVYESIIARKWGKRD